MLLSKLNFNDGILIRDGEFEILGQAIVNTDKKLLTFLDDENYIQSILKNRSISCVICKPEFKDYVQDSSLGIVLSDNPRLTFFSLHNELSNHIDFTLPKYPSIYGENCQISHSAVIAAENVKIGDNVIIEENVIIKEYVSIGNNVIIRSGSIIGGQGFEFKRIQNEGILRVNHVGSVIIDNNAELKEYVTVHKALFSWDSTVIGDNTKIDAHSHLGHAVKLGKRCLIGSHSNIAGNVTIEDNVYLGPSASISNRVYVRKDSRVSLGSVVNKNVAPGITVTGNFAIEHGKFIKALKNK